jgi:hypothetical protein
MKSNISATVVADSINSMGVRLTTFELSYPRFILAELNTHRMISKNSASSRAVPVERSNQIISENPAMPVHWGKNQTGMSAATELEGLSLDAAREGWIDAMKSALTYSKVLQSTGLHKQITNRIMEPWSYMKTVATGTEWANLLWLRNHNAAQPEFHRLAEKIQEAFDNSTPVELEVGQWHLPYIPSDSELTLEDKLKVSASCCAQVSYRRNDESLEKAIEIYDKLVGMDIPHFSPFEHQATPIPAWEPFTRWPDGVTHMDRNNKYWSGNFQGWIQSRQLIMKTKGIDAFSRNVG